ncbi:hypothetical protein AK830_g5406 [Neonectria ditissima]|uniref:Amidohydrolase 3 domain-containing protein n=1 Tax=Neonectria ditissima TaxID=78410 RepID=A0A0N8H796_9HYPO|nr:hypothetical protein AK830_g5406 [Neonectria ditissima]
MSSTRTPPASLFINGRILSKAESGLNGQPTFADSMFLQNGVITAIGPRNELAALYQQDGVIAQDLKGQMVLPGFIDGHMHLFLLGQSMQKLSLDHCKTPEEVVEAIRTYAKANPELPKLLAKGCLPHLTAVGVDVTVLDGIDRRPIFIDSMDVHSMWCNSAALEELGVANMPDPVGGKIERDADGNMTGLLSEGAVVGIAWPHLAEAASKEERIQTILSALEAYTASGYTGLVEMAMDELAWDAILTLYAQKPSLPMRITAYWLIKPGPEAECIQQVDRAIELQRKFSRENSSDLCITGIKIICDGTIDACTAALSKPYAIAPSPPPVWTKEQLGPVVKHAASAGLQIALHAIGDDAIRTAVNVLEAHTSPGGRHRIEHLELSSPEDAKRLGDLGITASIQPVHSDPAILREWPRLIGSHRCTRAFAYREFADSGALITLGSDSPTAPWDPLNNLYIATTRRSARETECEETVNKHFRLGFCEAVVAATAGAAKSVFAEDRVGTLEPGKIADFIIVDMEWDAQSLLKAKVKETWYGGKCVWSG